MGPTMGTVNRLENGLPRDLDSALSFWQTALGITAVFLATELGTRTMHALPSATRDFGSLTLGGMGSILWLSALYAICRRRQYRRELTTPWKVYGLLWSLFVYGFVMVNMIRENKTQLLTPAGIAWLLGGLALLAAAALLQNDPRRKGSRPAGRPLLS